MRDTFHRDPRINALIAIQNIKEFMEQISHDHVDERMAQRRAAAVAKLAGMPPPGWTRPDRPPLAAQTPVDWHDASTRGDTVVISDDARRGDRPDRRDDPPTVPELGLGALPPDDSVSA